MAFNNFYIVLQLTTEIPHSLFRLLNEVFAGMFVWYDCSFVMCMKTCKKPTWNPVILAFIWINLGQTNKSIIRLHQKADSKVHINTLKKTTPKNPLMWRCNCSESFHYVAISSALRKFNSLGPPPPHTRRLWYIPANKTENLQNL